MPIWRRGYRQSTGYLLTTYLNGPSASVYGVEAYWTQRLGFLPKPFDGIGVGLSGMIGDSEATYPTRPGEKIPFTGFSKEGGNAQITYDYSGLHLRAALHYHGARLESGSTIGTDATQDEHEAAYYTIDAGASYTFKQHWQIYLNASNLNNAPLKTIYGGTGSLSPHRHFRAIRLERRRRCALHLLIAGLARPFRRLVLGRIGRVFFRRGRFGQSDDAILPAGTGDSTPVPRRDVPDRD